MTTTTNKTQSAKTRKQFAIIEAETNQVIGTQPKYHLAWQFAWGFASSGDVPMPRIARVIPDRAA